MIKTKIKELKRLYFVYQERSLDRLAKSLMQLSRKIGDRHQTYAISQVSKYLEGSDNKPVKGQSLFAGHLSNPTKQEFYDAKKWPQAQTIVTNRDPKNMWDLKDMGLTEEEDLKQDRINNG